ncbi:MAG: sporulation protein YunB [bacterium]|nr:sporulation protein YunB [bacterium]
MSAAQRKNAPPRTKRGGRLRRRLRVALLLVLLLAAAFIRLERNLTGVVLSLSQARARALAVTALNQAADEIIREGVSYEQLMCVTRDENGMVRLLQANTQQMNLLASRVSLSAQRRLDAIEGQAVLVPLGSALGSSLLAGAGPHIRVSILPVGSVVASIGTEFESAGINQTRHKVVLTLRGDVRMIIPTGAATVEAVTEVAVAECIIVGEVPTSYVDVNNQDDMLNLIP